MDFPLSSQRLAQISTDFKEIAANMEISESTVKNTLLSALKAIRENIEEAGLWGTFILLVLKK